MNRNKKIKVAITGSIGSGKSTFSNFLKESGYPLICADDISKEILSHNLIVKKEIISTFGQEAFNKNLVNKKFLADNVFTDPEKLKKINSILHPRVREKINELCTEYFKSSDIIFIEAALIYESKIEKMYEYVVLITANEDLRLERSLESKKFSQKEFTRRNKNQLSDEVKIKKADFVFVNNGTKDELKQKAFLLITILKSILY